MQRLVLQSIVTKTCYSVIHSVRLHAHLCWLGYMLDNIGIAFRAINFELSIDRQDIAGSIFGVAVHIRWRLLLAACQLLIALTGDR